MVSHLQHLPDMESGCGDDAEQHVGVLRVDLDGDGLGHIGFSNSTFFVY